MRHRLAELLFAWQEQIHVDGQLSSKPQDAFLASRQTVGFASELAALLSDLSIR
jgi:hypothetical protein